MLDIYILKQRWRGIIARKDRKERGIENVTETETERRGERRKDTVSIDSEQVGAIINE